MFRDVDLFGLMTKITLTVAILLIFGVCSLAVFAGTRDVRVQRLCLERGFVKGKYYFSGPSYCSKRVNGSDSVIVIYLPNR